MAAGTAKQKLVRLPAVGRLLDHRRLRSAITGHGRGLIVDLVRERLDELRIAIKSGEDARFSETAIVAEVARRADELASASPRSVINATGVVVHTNLGRSILGADTAERVAEAARTYQDLEYDLDRGTRGQRLDHLEPLMARLFPGHGFAVVNNNAAAIMLCLRALASKKEVPVSRGELVEIGGSFRVPDIMSVSGAKLVEVGTTNRTKPADYTKAIGPKTGAILKVHTSNFTILGFTTSVTVADLARVARKHDVPLIVDWGSGALIDMAELGIKDEHPVIELLNDGADLVTFSGDKLLGGPQSGFIVGRADLVQKVRKDPIARACRLDRLRLGALRDVLQSYLRGKAKDEIPTLAMLAESAESIEKRAKRIQKKLGKQAKIIDGVSRTGGGSSPAGERPTKLIAIEHPDGDAAPYERALRQGSPPVVARLQDGKLLLDLRTVLPGQETALAVRLKDVLRR